MLVDSHCHLADPAFEADREAVLARARDAGVGHVVVVGENPERSDAARAIARAHRRCSATAGLHPHEARRWSAEVERRLADAAADPVVVAVGETGLDYHYDHSPRERQREAFDAQLDLGTRTGKPVVVHAREADEDVARLLRNHPVGPLAGVAFNLTLLSYEDRLDMGINTDASAIGRPGELRAAIQAAITEFGSL